MNKNTLIIGGSGALGSALTNKLKQASKIFNIDLVPNPSASKNILLDPSSTVSTQLASVLPQIDEPLGAIFCTAGGFAMESLDSPHLFTSLDSMISMNFNSTLLGARIGAERLSQNGLFVSTGADHVFHNIAPEMLTYALSKNLVHNLHMLVCENGEFKEKGVDCICILPTTIDSEANRAAMPDADFAKWLDPSKISDLLKMWVESQNRPSNGAFVKLSNQDGFVTGVVI